ncbi:hypothetical protein [Croceicoccus sp. Ery15]|uniref:hypothetical protein n=1 Tax=Croceicoccus sp. Ery15 TaxID=1703338 RepID=UPI001E41BE86|nr:hypothetical protein [Croceicoccus sp. Ery15]
MQQKLTSDAEMLRSIEAFCRKHKLGVTTFGRLAISDANLVANLRAGRSLTLKTANSIADFMTTYRPQDAAA